MFYILWTLVAIAFRDTPTRDLFNGPTVDTTRPRPRADNLPQVFWIVAVSQDPFARVFCTHAPLARRNCSATILAKFFGNTLSTLRAL